MAQKFFFSKKYILLQSLLYKSISRNFFEKNPENFYKLNYFILKSNKLHAKKKLDLFKNYKKGQNYLNKNSSTGIKSNSKNCKKKLAPLPRGLYTNNGLRIENTSALRAVPTKQLTLAKIPSSFKASFFQPMLSTLFLGWIKPQRDTLLLEKRKNVLFLSKHEVFVDQDLDELGHGGERRQVGTFQTLIQTETEKNILNLNKVLTFGYKNLPYKKSFLCYWFLPFLGFVCCFPSLYSSLFFNLDLGKKNLLNSVSCSENLNIKLKNSFEKNPEVNSCNREKNKREFTENLILRSLSPNINYLEKNNLSENFNKKQNNLLNNFLPTFLNKNCKRIYNFYYKELDQNLINGNPETFLNASSLINVLNNFYFTNKKTLETENSLPVLYFKTFNFLKSLKLQEATFKIFWLNSSFNFYLLSNEKNQQISNNLKQNLNFEGLFKKLNIANLENLSLTKCTLKKINNFPFQQNTNYYFLFSKKLQKNNYFLLNSLNFEKFSSNSRKNFQKILKSPKKSFLLEFNETVCSGRDVGSGNNVKPSHSLVFKAPVRYDQFPLTPSGYSQFILLNKKIYRNPILSYQTASIILDPLINSHFLTKFDDWISLNVLKKEESKLLNFTKLTQLTFLTNSKKQIFFKELRKYSQRKLCNTPFHFNRNFFKLDNIFSSFLQMDTLNFYKDQKQNNLSTLKLFNNFSIKNARIKENTNLLEKTILFLLRKNNLIREKKSFQRKKQISLKYSLKTRKKHKIQKKLLSKNHFHFKNLTFKSLNFPIFNKFKFISKIDSNSSPLPANFRHRFLQKFIVKLKNIKKVYEKTIPNSFLNLTSCEQKNYPLKNQRKLSLIFQAKLKKENLIIKNAYLKKVTKESLYYLILQSFNISLQKKFTESLKLKNFDLNKVSNYKFFEFKPYFGTLLKKWSNKRNKNSKFESIDYENDHRPQLIINRFVNDFLIKNEIKNPQGWLMYFNNQKHLIRKNQLLTFFRKLKISKTSSIIKLTYPLWIGNLNNAKVKTINKIPNFYLNHKVQSTKDEVLKKKNQKFPLKSLCIKKIGQEKQTKTYLLNSNNFLKNEMHQQNKSIELLFPKKSNQKVLKSNKKMQQNFISSLREKNNDNYEGVNFNNYQTFISHINALNKLSYFSTYINFLNVKIKKILLNPTNNQGIKQNNFFQNSLPLVKPKINFRKFNNYKNFAQKLPKWRLEKKNSSKKSGWYANFNLSQFKKETLKENIIFKLPKSTFILNKFSKKLTEFGSDKSLMKSKILLKLNKSYLKASRQNILKNLIEFNKKLKQSKTAKCDNLNFSNKKFFKKTYSKNEIFKRKSKFKQPKIYLLKKKHFSKVKPLKLERIFHKYFYHKFYTINKQTELKKKKQNLFFKDPLIVSLTLKSFETLKIKELNNFILKEQFFVSPVTLKQKKILRLIKNFKNINLLAFNNLISASNLNKNFFIKMQEKENFKKKKLIISSPNLLFKNRRFLTKRTLKRFPYFHFKSEDHSINKANLSTCNNLMEVDSMLRNLQKKNKKISKYSMKKGFIKLTYKNLLNNKFQNLYENSIDLKAKLCKKKFIIKYLSLLEKRKYKIKKYRKNKRNKKVFRRKKRGSRRHTPKWYSYHLSKKIFTLRHLVKQKSLIMQKTTDSFIDPTKLINSSRNFLIKNCDKTIKLNFFREKIYRNYKQEPLNLYFQKNNGRNYYSSIKNQNTINNLFTVRDFSFFENYNFFKVYKIILGDLKKPYWKSYWLRKNFDFYVKRMAKYLDQMREFNESYILTFKNKIFFEKNLCGFNFPKREILNKELQKPLSNCMPIALNFNKSQPYPHKLLTEKSSLNSLFSNKYALICNLNVYENIISQRIQQSILNIRENLDFHGKFSKHAYKLGKEKLASRKMIKTWWLKFIKAISFEQPMPSPIYFSEDISKVRTLWTLNKSNLGSLKPNKKRKDVWIDEKLRYQKKYNKTKKIIYNMNRKFSTFLTEKSQQVAKVDQSSNLNWKEKLKTKAFFKKFIFEQVMSQFYPEHINKINVYKVEKPSNKSFLHEEISFIKEIESTGKLEKLKHSFKILELKLKRKENKLSYLGFLTKKTNKFALQKEELREFKNQIFLKSFGRINLWNSSKKTKFKITSSILLKNDLLKKKYALKINLLKPTYLNPVVLTTFTTESNYWWNSVSIQWIPTFKHIVNLNLSQNSLKKMYANETIIWISSFIFHFCTLLFFINISEIRGLINFQIIFISKIFKKSLNLSFKISSTFLEIFDILNEKNLHMNSHLTNLIKKLKTLIGNKEKKKQIKQFSQSLRLMNFKINFKEVSFIKPDFKHYKNFKFFMNPSTYGFTVLNKIPLLNQSFDFITPTAVPELGFSGSIGSLPPPTSSEGGGGKAQPYLVKGKGKALSNEEDATKGLNLVLKKNSFNVKKHLIYSENFLLLNKTIIPLTLQRNNKIEAMLKVDLKNKIKIYSIYFFNEIIYLSFLHLLTKIFFNKPNFRKPKRNFLDFKKKMILFPNYYFPKFTRLTFNSISKSIVFIDFFISNIVGTIIDIFQLITGFLYYFIDRPEGILVALVAEIFLIEWASDLTELVPDSVDISRMKSFFKISRGVQPFLVSTKLKLFQISSVNNSFLLSLGLLLSVSSLIQRQILTISDKIIQKGCQPETDFLIREKKGIIFSNLWSDILIEVAEDNNINLSELTSLKEEQNRLLEKLEVYTLQESSFNNFYENLPNNKIQGMSKSIKYFNTNFNFILGKPYYLLEAKNSFNIENKNVFPSSEKSLQIDEQSKGSHKNVFLQKQKIDKKFFNEIERNWSVDQFFNYQAKNTELFIQKSPSKSFSHSASIKYSLFALQPVGEIVCQIFAGLFNKEVAKNVLVVGPSYQSKKFMASKPESVLIQAIAGETELKIIVDNAHRYSMSFSGVAIGIKLLRDVFEALSMYTPCIFLLEDIHHIGGCRPFLFSEQTKCLNSNEFISDGEIDEKHQAIYELSRHLVSHYNKPYKGASSVLIPTNHFCFNLFLGVSSAQIRKNKLPFVNSLNSENADSIKNLTSTSKDQEHSKYFDEIDKPTKNNIFSTSLQIQANTLLAPPSTSPFSILVLKENMKFNAKQIVKEIPWSGLTAEKLALISKSNYSIRLKVALLADRALSNLSAKLEMITELLIIVDTVGGNRGFIVFGTTHIPYTLDPALRRPGRFDETISIPLIPNLFSRWEILKATIKDSSQFSPYSYFVKGLSIDFTNISTLFQSNYDFSKLNNKFLTFKKKFKQIESPLVTRKGLMQNHQTENSIMLKKFTLTSNLNNKIEQFISPLQIKNSLKNMNILNKNLILLKNQNILTKKIFLNILARTYFFASQWVANFKENDLHKFSSNKLKKENKNFKMPPIDFFLFYSSTYLSFYSSEIFFKKYLMKLIAGKLGEVFLFSTLVNYSKLNLKPNQLQANTRLMNLYGMDKTLRSAAALLFFLITKKYIYNKNLIIPKLLYFSSNWQEISSAPASTVLLPLRGYENYRRNFNIEQIKNKAHFQGKTIESIIELHQQQRFIKRLYKLPLRQFFRSEIINSKLTTFTNAFITLSSIEKTMNFTTNINWYYRSRILNRHQNYLNNQWWNGQLSEHNLENIFLSDIEWRYTFVESIGDIFIDFPDPDQFYNIKNRRWMLNLNGSESWLNFEKTNFSEIFNQYMFESFVKAYNSLDEYREILDVYVFTSLNLSMIKELKEISLISILKRFYT